MQAVCCQSLVSTVASTGAPWVRLRPGGRKLLHGALLQWLLAHCQPIRSRACQTYPSISALWGLRRWPAAGLTPSGRWDRETADAGAVGGEGDDGAGEQGGLDIGEGSDEESELFVGSVGAAASSSPAQLIPCGGIEEDFDARGQPGKGGRDVRRDISAERTGDRIRFRGAGDE